MKTPDTIVYGQDSEVALTCFHQDSLFWKCQAEQAKKNSGPDYLIMLATTPYIQTIVLLHIIAFSVVTEHFQDAECVCFTSLLAAFAPYNSNLINIIVQKKN